MTVGSWVDLVVPTAGRPALEELLEALAASTGPLPANVLLVDDRREPGCPLLVDGPPPRLAGRVKVLRGRAAGPAAARNVGWRASSAEWVAFLDDDVVPDPGWLTHLVEDLAKLGPGAVGSQGRVRVPLPEGRRPTDRERNVKGLETSRWITADIAYRRAVLEEVGGFDERFPRAYREDADLGLRVTGAGYGIVSGRRSVAHPVRPSDRFVSVRLQAGNADDALMRALHGPDWRRRAGIPAGRRPLHLLTTAAGLTGLAALICGRRKLGAVGVAGWLAGTAELAWARIAPGPRTREEVATMLLTSALLPATATVHWLAGLLRHRNLLVAPAPEASTVDAVLLDRDGTLVVDVPYNGDPGRVVPVPGARDALDRLRAAGVPLGVVSNQSGVARGLLTRDEVDAVNRQIEELLGPLGPWVCCPHAPDDGCSCRKPAPGLVFQAANKLGVDPRRCAVIGDIGSDVEAALAAGARGILVPTERTLPEEIEAAPEVVRDLAAAVDLLLGEKG
jgi:histidinol-phosphate phosphatase family protein